MVNNVWAKLTTLFYYPVKIVGLENLPGPDQAAVYVANHQSFLVSAPPVCRQREGGGSMKYMAPILTHNNARFPFN